MLSVGVSSLYLLRGTAALTDLFIRAIGGDFVNSVPPINLTENLYSASFIIVV